jgi:hypothetical protein
MDIIGSKRFMRRRKQMKLVALNGSPRKGWNTEQLLQKAMEGISH